MLPKPDAPRVARADKYGPTSKEELDDIEAELEQMRMLTARSRAAAAEERTEWPPEAPERQAAGAGAAAAPAGATEATGGDAAATEHAGPSPLLQLVGACRQTLREEVDRSLFDTLAEVADERRRGERRKRKPGEDPEAAARAPPAPP